LAPGDTIDVGALAGVVRLDPRPVAPDNVREKAGMLRELKEVAERAFLVEKLGENGWNLSRTAEGIDPPRSNLYKKLEQYRISQESDG
jgi:two-component system nitrogen regulation response regulator NtrX